MPYISNLVLPFKTNKNGLLGEQPVFLYIRWLNYASNAKRL